MQETILKIGRQYRSHPVYRTLLRKSHLCIPFLGIAWPNLSPNFHRPAPHLQCTRTLAKGGTSRLFNSVTHHIRAHKYKLQITSWRNWPFNSVTQHITDHKNKLQITSSYRDQRLYPFFWQYLPPFSFPTEVLSWHLPIFFIAPTSSTGERTAPNRRLA
jgi:hypothetical protein